jgi:AmmeMemoRadiSam system protein B
MNIRQPVRAGSFYEDAAPTCRHHAVKLVESAHVPADLPEKLYGGLVPHAGWDYSGKLSALTFKSLLDGRGPVTLVLFGADHVGTARKGEVFDSGVWQTPIGQVQVDDVMAKALLDGNDLLRANPAAHLREHSIEVQIPIIQVLCPDARIVPIEVPPEEVAVQIGHAVGKRLAELYPDAIVVGSTDLTHHGGHFPSPGGHGQEGVHWSRENDQRMLGLIKKMDANAVIIEAQARGNACGAGAIAATIAACMEMGATQGILLQYTNSYEVSHAMFPQETDDTTVGYASVAFA